MDLSLVACAILTAGHVALLVLVSIDHWASSRVADRLFMGAVLAEAAGFVCAVAALIVQATH